VTDVKNLVSRLAKGSFADSTQIIDVVIRWYLASFKSGYLEIFKSRLVEKFSTNKV
jgi:hypothetical protein